MYRFVPHFKVKRKPPLPIEAFTVAWDAPSTARELESKAGRHTFAEYLSADRTGDVKTKLYFDTERYVDGPPSKDVHDAYLTEVHGRMDALMAELRKVAPDADYVIAQRHGPSGERHKLSFRTYVLGVAVDNYAAIPAFIASDLVPAEFGKPAARDGFWDWSVYKASDQLLCTVYGIKHADDTRCLRPATGYPKDPLCYVVQHVDAEWPVFNSQLLKKPAAVVCEPTKDSNMAFADDVDELVTYLAPSTSSDRDKWFRVACGLRHEARERGLPEDRYLEAWLRFSRLGGADYTGDADCRHTWKSADKRVSGPESTLGTVIMYAQQDSPMETEQWKERRKKAKRARTEAKAVVVPTDPDQKRLWDMAAEFGHVSAQTPGLEWTAVDAGPVEALAAHMSKALELTPSPAVVSAALVLYPESKRRWVFMALEDVERDYGTLIGMDTHDLRVVRDGQALGFMDRYTGGLRVPDSVEIGSILKMDVNGRFDWMLRRPNDSTACFEGTPAQGGNNDATPLQVQVAHIHDKSLCSAKLVHMGQTSMITTARTYNVLRRAYDETLEQARAQWNLNVVLQQTVINVSVGSPAVAAGDEVRSDADLAELWFKFLGEEVSEEERGKWRIVYNPNQKEFIYFDGPRGTWARTHVTSVASNHMWAAMKTVNDGKFLSAVLTPDERRYMGKNNGGVAVFNRSLNYMIDTRFPDRLDARRDLLPFDNGVVDLNTLEFRPLAWDDYVTCTIGYDYKPVSEVEQDHFREWETFYERILPVIIERRLALWMASCGLDGRRWEKKFGIFTDCLGGDNGKSTWLELLLRTYGKFGAPTQNNFLYKATLSGSNQHETNDLNYMGKRLAVFDETSATSTLDMDKLKRLTGGGVRMAMRRARADAMTEFDWTAFIIIGCNENNFPKVDACDRAFVNRMMAVPMRAKFNNEAHAAGVQYAFPMVEGLKDKLEQFQMAHMHILLRALAECKAAGGFNAPGAIPASSLELRSKLLEDADPRLATIAAYVDAQVELKAASFIARQDLVDDFRTKDAFHKPILARIKVADLKSIFDRVMASRGIQFVIDTTVAGERARQAYVGIGWKGGLIDEGGDE